MKSKTIPQIEKEERQLEAVIKSRLKSGAFTYYGTDSIIFGREKVDGVSCLILSNEKGEIAVLSPSFEKGLLRIIERKEEVDKGKR